MLFWQPTYKTQKHKTWFSWQNSYFNNSSWKVFSWTFDKKKCQAFFSWQKKETIIFWFFFIFSAIYVFVCKKTYVAHQICLKRQMLQNTSCLEHIFILLNHGNLTFFTQKVYRLNDPIKYCLMFDRENVEIRHKATLLNMASCWYFVFTPSLFS